MEGPNRNVTMPMGDVRAGPQSTWHDGELWRMQIGRRGLHFYPRPLPSLPRRPRHSQRHQLPRYCMSRDRLQVLIAKAPRGRLSCPAFAGRCSVG